MKKLLQAYNISHTYFSGGNSINVLIGVDLKVCKGEIVSIIGPSGSGKTTLLSILGTLLRPTKGRVELEGISLFSLSDDQLAYIRNRKVGFIFQSHHLLPDLTVLENVMLPGLMLGRFYFSVKKDALKIINELEMSHKINSKPSELSGGEIQLTATARAMINNPIIILADEPTENIDDEHCNYLQNLFWNLKESKNQTFVIVTHNEKWIEKSDRVFKLENKRLIEWSELVGNNVLIYEN